MTSGIRSAYKILTIMAYLQPHQHHNWASWSVAWWGSHHRRILYQGATIQRIPSPPAVQVLWLVPGLWQEDFYQHWPTDKTMHQELKLIPCWYFMHNGKDLWFRAAIPDLTGTMLTILLIFMSKYFIYLFFFLAGRGWPNFRLVHTECQNSNSPSQILVSLNSQLHN